jgi:hypothetical protein
LLRLQIFSPQFIFTHTVFQKIWSYFMYSVRSYLSYWPVSSSDTVFVSALLTTMFEEARPTTRGAITTHSWKTFVTNAWKIQTSKCLCHFCFHLVLFIDNNDIIIIPNLFTRIVLIGQKIKITHLEIWKCDLFHKWTWKHVVHGDNHVLNFIVRELELPVYALTVSLRNLLMCKHWTF